MIETKSTYRELLLSEPWQRKRQAILKRDDSRCRNCGTTYGLEVHHRQYHVDPVTGEKRAPWEYADNYLVTLCANCHLKGHQQYRIPVFKH
ncbi:MAG: HNH endonuclease [Sphingobacteriales bacterium]|nr:MAG: HNH endonuclease [Sphingobacteriales bacterium]